MAAVHSSLTIPQSNVSGLPSLACFSGSRVASAHRSLRFPSHVGLRLSFSSTKVESSKLKLDSSQSRPLLIRAQNQGNNRESWDFGRFFQTVAFFNTPSLGSMFGSIVKSFTGPDKEPAPKITRKGELVLVVGATGGVGKRVVDVLRKKGVNVKALVRNEEKAKKLLGNDVPLAIADLVQRQTLLSEYFEGVTKVINCSAVIVGPKEGDTEDRQKYNQGIKFYDPEIKGDTPETVEFLGMKNLLDALKDNLGKRNGKALFAIAENGFPMGPAWGALDDVVMGGVSKSGLQIDSTGGENGQPVGLFTGVVSTTNNGGFASIRTKNFSPIENLSAYDGIELRVKGDGHRFKLIIRTTIDWDAIGYTTSFDTIPNQWQTIRLPFSSFVPVFRAKTVNDAAPFKTANIASLQLMYSKFEYDGKLNPSFEPGKFTLPVAYIKAYLNDPVTPRIVHVGSAGVTRPDRPGLDLSRQPPAVRMNKELGGILTFKLKGEDVIRESGIPHCIIRPCALTEEPAGADLIFDQGDNITGKIGREEVARICVAALESPLTVDKTFEVKSSVPFSEQFTVDEANPPPPRDYTPFFQNLVEGITGKELLDAPAVAKS